MGGYKEGGGEREGKVQDERRCDRKREREEVRCGVQALSAGAVRLFFNEFNKINTAYSDIHFPK